MKIETRKKLSVLLLIFFLMIETCALLVPAVKASFVGFPSLVPYDFNDQTSSLRVVGTVILYGYVDYGNGTIAFDTDNGTVPDLRIYGWNDRASSLKVDGTVTLYSDINYGGKRMSFTSNDLSYDDLGTEWNLNPNLTISEGKWDARVYNWSPLSWIRGRIVSPDSGNYVNWSSDGLVESHCLDNSIDGICKAVDFEQGYESSDVTPSYQPPLLSVADSSSITVEGVVKDCGSGSVAFPGWSGVKFDVWAVENKTDDKSLMLEMYFIRTGANLLWNPDWFFPTNASGNTENYRVAIDAFPQFASRIAYDGVITKWTIDVRGLIEKACDSPLARLRNLNFNSLFVRKICFTLETSCVLSPAECYGKLLRLRLCYSSVPKADVNVVCNGPNYVERGKPFNYTINYFNAGSGTAANVSIVDSLPPNSTFVSASDGGIYIPVSNLSWPFLGTNRVIWSLGTMPPFSSGFVTVTVTTSPTTPFGTVLSNTVFIFATSQESNSNNNQDTKSTAVSEDSSIPLNVDVGPTTSSCNHMPVLCWTTPTTFTYYGETNVTGVSINIHMLDGGPEIGGSMTNMSGTHNWSFTHTFYPRHGQAIVNNAVYYADGQQMTTTYGILVGASGYVYDDKSGERIQGATVTLLRYDTASQQFVKVSSNDPNMEPNTNSETTDESGGYGWIASPAIYMIQAEKEGYSTNFATVSVPIDVNIPLTALGVHYSIEPVAVSPLTDIDGSVNGLETPATPSPVNLTFNVEIHLRNATLANAPAGVSGAEVHFFFGNILTYAVPTGFTDFLGTTGGVLTGPQNKLLYGIPGGFYDASGNPVSSPPYTGAKYYEVAAASTGRPWNGSDGLVAVVSFRITKQPQGSLGEPTVTLPLINDFTDVTDPLANSIPHGTAQGTLTIDARSGTVYIRSDGSVDPPEAPIQRVGNCYTLTGNIGSSYDGLVIERNDTILDGAGYIQGGGNYTGIQMSSVNNVTINNVNIENSNEGVNARFCSNCTIINSVISNTRGNGVNLYGSYGCNVVVRNYITNNSVGVSLMHVSPNDNVVGNNIANNSIGISFYNSYGSNVRENNITANTLGVNFNSHASSTFYHNNFIDNGQSVNHPIIWLSSWDNGYPSGGNYWSNYNGIDSFRGPYQNLTGGDGIGDTPYTIDANNTDHYPLMNPWSPHDIAVTNVLPSKTTVGQGCCLNMSATVANLGDFTEAVNVSMYYNGVTQRILLPPGASLDSLLNGTSADVILTWNTTGTAYGNYTVGAHASPVLGDTNTANNNCTYCNVVITIPGDINGDFKVGLSDLTLLANAYGSKQGDTKWNPNADINNDGTVGLSELTILAKHYNQHYP